MAIVVIAESPGVTAEDDAAIGQRLNVTNQPPAGSLARLAGPIEGGWRVLSVWESLEAWETFRRERLEPALREAGRPSPQIEIWPVHSVRIAPQGR